MVDNKSRLVRTKRRQLTTRLDRNTDLIHCSTVLALTFSAAFEYFAVYFVLQIHLAHIVGCDWDCETRSIRATHLLYSTEIYLTATKYRRLQLRHGFVHISLAIWHK